MLLYGHENQGLKIKDSQLPILQSQVAHLLEPTFCCRNFKIASKTRIAELLELILGLRKGLFNNDKCDRQTCLTC
jgi:hypothetical protein